MANVQIQIDGAGAARQLKQAFSQMSDKDFNRALSLGLNVSAQKVRTITARDIKDTYNIRYSYLTKRTMPIGKARANKLESTISLLAKPVPMSEFLKNSPNKSGVRVSVLKGQSKLIKGAFIFRSKYNPSGRLSIMHRSNVTGDSSYTNGSFQFRHKRLQPGSDLTIGAIFSVSPLHSIFNKILQENITNAGRLILERETARIMSDMASGLIRDAKRHGGRSR